MNTEFRHVPASRAPTPDVSIWSNAHYRFFLDLRSLRWNATSTSRHSSPGNVSTAVPSGSAKRNSKPPVCLCLPLMHFEMLHVGRPTAQSICRTFQRGMVPPRAATAVDSTQHCFAQWVAAFPVCIMMKHVFRWSCILKIGHSIATLVSVLVIDLRVVWRGWWVEKSSCHYTVNKLSSPVAIYLHVRVYVAILATNSRGDAPCVGLYSTRRAYILSIQSQSWSRVNHGVPHFFWNEPAKVTVLVFKTLSTRIPPAPPRDCWLGLAKLFRRQCGRSIPSPFLGSNMSHHD